MEARAPVDLAELAEVAGLHPSAQLVVLFGSVARGTPFPWSDADIGVLGGTWLERLKLGAALGRSIGRDPHVVDLERAPEALRQEIARQGLLVREATPGTWSDYRAQSFVRWFDFAPLRRRCAEGVRRRLREEARRGRERLTQVAGLPDCIARVHAALPAEPRAILTDERLEAFISFNLFLLVQDSVDLAAHLIAEQGLGVPDSHRGAFEILAGKGLLSREVAEGMGAMASLRNRIAHAYGDLDPIRMVREAPVGLEIVARFLDELAAHA